MIVDFSIFFPQETYQILLPQAFCEVEPESCFAATALSGCALQKPCWPLEVDDCVMDRRDGNGDGNAVGWWVEDWKIGFWKNDMNTYMYIIYTYMIYDHICIYEPEIYCCQLFIARSSIGTGGTSGNMHGICIAVSTVGCFGLHGSSARRLLLRSLQGALKSGGFPDAPSVSCFSLKKCTEMYKSTRIESCLLNFPDVVDIIIFSHVIFWWYLISSCILEISQMFHS